MSFYSNKPSRESGRGELGRPDSRSRTENLDADIEMSNATPTTYEEVRRLIDDAINPLESRIFELEDDLRELKYPRRNHQPRRNDYNSPRPSYHSGPDRRTRESNRAGPYSVNSRPINHRRSRSRSPTPSSSHRDQPSSSNHRRHDSRDTKPLPVPPRVPSPDRSHREVPSEDELLQHKPRGFTAIALPQSVEDIQRLIRDAQQLGNWVAFRRVHRIWMVSKAGSEAGVPLSEGCQYLLTSRWEPPAWIHNARRAKVLFDDDERTIFPWLDPRPVIAQANPTLSPEAQAAWYAIYSNPIQYPGISISTTLRVDLATIPGFNLLQQIRPNKRSTTGFIITANQRIHFLRVLLSVVAPVGIYKQYLAHWKLKVAPMVKLDRFSGNDAGNITVYEMVRNMAQQGITVDMVNTCSEWAISALMDVPIIYPELSTEWTELQSSVNQRLRMYGVSPSILDDSLRIWTPPSTWNIYLMFQERRLWITQAGQQLRGTYKEGNSRKQAAKTTGSNTAGNTQLPLGNDRSNTPTTRAIPSEPASESSAVIPKADGTPDCLDSERMVEE
ncbi:hypothetical protein VNI00_016659 [Paramarasmius palmivorus]|uniref:Uncharacterized protein n=1 Tax=Paramarasmius palmivorus TaxID=297713 RepID=A0AAW0BCP1_9AGAR